MKLICKSTKLGEGTIRTHGGIRKKKVGDRWIALSQAQGKQQLNGKKALDNFTTATRYSGKAGNLIAEVLSAYYKINNFKDLKRYISRTPGEASHELFKNVKSYLVDLDTSTGEKRAATDFLARSLITLKAYYAKPKTKLMVRIEGKKKGDYGRIFKYKDPIFKPSTLKAAKLKLGGWSNMSKSPTLAQVNTMIKNKSAKLLYGKALAKKKWSIDQRVGVSKVPWKETAKGITVQLKQVKQMKKRTSRTALIEITIPYAYAKQFLDKNIKGTKTRGNLSGQLIRSKGYKKFLEKNTKRVL